MPSSRVARAYASSADAYDVFAENSRTWLNMERPLLEQEVGPLIGGGTRILDLGCGSGRTIGWALEKGARPENIVGIEMLRSLAAKTRERYPGVRVINAGLGRVAMYRFRRHYFDLAVANMVCQYLDEWTFTRMLYLAGRTLKRGGTLHIVFPTIRNGEGYGWKWHRTPWGAKIPYFRRPAAHWAIFPKLYGLELVGMGHPPIASTKAWRNEDGTFRRPDEWSRMHIALRNDAGPVIYRLVGEGEEFMRYFG